MFFARLLLGEAVFVLALALAGVAEDLAIVRAGELVRCTLEEPNLSSATVAAGEPVVCYLMAFREFGHSVFPRGSFRRSFRLFWTWKVRHGQPGRPVFPREVRDLIGTMCRENLTWGAPRIHGELLKLGIDIGETSVSKYMVRCHKPPSQTWRTFLENHLSQLVSVDFFTVPTIRFQVLYVFLVLAHDRRRILHFNVTAHPTAEWTAQQLQNAFPFERFPRYLLRDRDAIFGQGFREQVRDMSIEEVLSTPRSPWQRAYVERVIGSIRRECLDHLILFDESSLRRILASYVEYYHRCRTHLSLDKDSPEPRPVQSPEVGPIVSVRQVGGLHHRYERQAA